MTTNDELRATELATALLGEWGTNHWEKCGCEKPASQVGFLHLDTWADRCHAPWPEELVLYAPAEIIQDLTPAAVDRLISLRAALLSNRTAELVSRNTALESELGPADSQCCMCGKKGLSTVEDGGPECQLPDDRWTCSRECYNRATGEHAPIPSTDGWMSEDDLIALNGGLMGAVNFGLAKVEMDTDHAAKIFTMAFAALRLQTRLVEVGRVLLTASRTPSPSHARRIVREAVTSMVADLTSAAPTDNTALVEPTVSSLVGDRR